MELKRPAHRSGERAGDYRMGFELEACSGGSLVRVFIEYSRPRGWLGGMLRALFGGYYAR